MAPSDLGREGFVHYVTALGNLTFAFAFARRPTTANPLAALALRLWLWLWLWLWFCLAYTNLLEGGRFG
ncbi:hypothetical protein F4861DRAFT_144014 [Xylaria intraflava]|nr:hypothetical protein F4861DRAFT_144014 [Xylaria intraflava]